MYYTGFWGGGKCKNSQEFKYILPNVGGEGRDKRFGFSTKYHHQENVKMKLKLPTAWECVFNIHCKVTQVSLEKPCSLIFNLF